MITSDNFCRIEQVGHGVKVLFWAEYDGDEVILHQVATLEIGTLDLKVSMPAEKFEAIWPDSIRFADAAAKVIATAQEMGFAATHHDVCPMTEGPDHG